MNTLTETEIALIRAEVARSVMLDSDLSARKRSVAVKLTSLYLNYESFAAIRAAMAEFEAEYTEYTSFETRQHGDGFGDEKYTYVYGIREETDEELIDREAAAREREVVAERADRATFERLSQRFGA